MLTFNENNILVRDLEAPPPPDRMSQAGNIEDESREKGQAAAAAAQ